MSTRQAPHPISFSGISTALISVLCAVFLYAAEPEEPGVVILSSEPNAENQQGFTNAVVIPLPHGGSIMALRTQGTGVPAYTFMLEQANLVALLQVLAQSMIPPVEITLSPYEIVDYSESGMAAPTVAIKTAIAYVLDVSIQVDSASLMETLDQAAIASGCNIYLDGQTIVVDRC